MPYWGIDLLLVIGSSLITAGAFIFARRQKKEADSTGVSHSWAVLDIHNKYTVWLGEIIKYQEARKGAGGIHIRFNQDGSHDLIASPSLPGHKISAALLNWFTKVNGNGREKESILRQ